VENVVEVRSNEIRSIEIRYAGVVVGRSTKVRDWGTAGAFIGFAEPLPSGTSLVLRGDGVDQPARVVEVFESADPAVAGMQVKFVGAAEAARPAQKPAAVAAKSEPAPTVAPTRAPAVVPTSTAGRAPVAAEAASAAPVSEVPASDAPASPATSDQGEGEAGQSEHAEQGGQAGSGGKRRRRRR
jgi:hypothetical protein